MQIRAADTRSCDSNDGVLRMQDLRHGFMVDADPQRPPVIHGEHRNESFLFRLLQTTSSLCLDYAPAPVAAGWGGGGGGGPRGLSGPAGGFFFKGSRPSLR